MRTHLPSADVPSADVLSAQIPSAHLPSASVRLALALVLASVVAAMFAGCAVDGGVAPPPAAARPDAHTASSAEREGAVPKGATVFDDHLPAVSGLDPTLRAALRDASIAAQEDGVSLVVNSGWRSADLQSRLLREAIATYGSEEEAARWVATAETSPHVSGDAVDIGPWAGADWLGRHGEAYGLCQIYVNEAWHFEYRSEATTQGCPRMFLDPTRDPRMG